MGLRWFQTYDKNGLNSEITLQYWDKDYEEWIDVPFVRISDYCDNFDDFMLNPDATWSSYGKGE